MPNFLGARDPESFSSGIFMEIHFVPTISLEEFDDSNSFMMSRYVTIEGDRGATTGHILLEQFGFGIRIIASVFCKNKTILAILEHNIDFIQPF